MSVNTPGGKGSKPRPVDLETYVSNYDRIFGKKTKPEPDSSVLAQTPEAIKPTEPPLTSFYSVIGSGGYIKAPTSNFRWLEYTHDHGDGTASTRTKLQQAFQIDDGSFLWEDIPTVNLEKTT